MAKKNKGQRRGAQKKQQSQHENAQRSTNGSTAPPNSNGDANHYRNSSSDASAPTPRRGTMSPLRWTLMFMASCYFFVNAFQHELFPYGFPVAMNGSGSRGDYQPSIDDSNDSLQIKHGRTKRIYERVPDGQKPLMVGPESTAIGKDGTLYILSEKGKLVSLTDFQEEPENDRDGISSTITAKATVVKDLGVGRPLGGKFTNDGKTLYIADAVLGLTRIKNFQDPTSKLELVVSSFVDEGNNQSTDSNGSFQFVDDVCIGPKTGKVYFSDASSIATERVGSPPWSLWDCLYASKVNFMLGKKTGRIFEYDPKTDKVKLLAKDIHFANGIAVDKDESYLFFAETYGPKLWKFHLKGKQKGSSEMVVAGLGYPDGADCSWPSSKKDSTKCYAVFASSIIPVHKLLANVPDVVDVVLRALLLLLPRNLSPQPVPYGGILEVDPVTKQHRYIQDPAGTDISMLTGVTVHENKLYLGSLSNNYIGVYDLTD